MKILKQALAVFVAVSMLSVGMVGTAVASETVDGTQMSKVSAQVTADSDSEAQMKEAGKEKKSSDESVSEKSSGTEESSEGKEKTPEDTGKETDAAKADEKEEEDTCTVKAEKGSESGSVAEKEVKEEASEEAAADRDDKETAESREDAGEAAEAVSADSSEKSEMEDSTAEGDSAKEEVSEVESSTQEADEGPSEGAQKDEGVITAGPESETVTEKPSDSMLPIKEKKAYLVLHGLSDDELKNMSVTSMLERMMDEEGKPLSIPDDAEMVWTHYKDKSGNLLTDEYHKISRDETVDLTDLKDADVYRLEMIVGSGNQLDPGNTRYLVSVYFHVNEELHFELYSQENGTRKKINTEDIKFIKTKDSGYTNQSGEPIEGWAYYIVPEGTTSMDDLYIGMTSSIEELPFVNIKVHDTIEVFQEGSLDNTQNIYSTVMNQNMSEPDAGYHLQYDPYSDLYTAFSAFALVYNVAGIVDTQPVMFMVSHGCMETIPTLHTVNEEQEIVPVTDSITNKIALQLNTEFDDDYDCLLSSGYIAADTYQLSLDVITSTVNLKIGIESGKYKFYVDHENGDNMNSKVTRAVVGNFTSVDEVMNQPDIKDQLFSQQGYSSNFAGDGIIFTLYFGDDWQPGTGELYRMKVSARGNETLMKDYDEAPIVGSQDPWFRVTGLMLDGEELDTYVVENGKSINMDTYYGYGYQTIMVNQALTQEETARLVPIFEVGDPDRVSIRLPGSEKALVSSKDKVDFSGEDQKTGDDDLAHFVALIDGHTKNYQVRVISKNNGPKLYVYDDYSNEGGQRFREILLDDYFEEKHDILIANVGDETLTGLKVKLDLEEGADHVKLDDYWFVGGEGNNSLEPFTSTADMSTYGMIPNIAKIRLIPDGEGDIEGKITISADGQEDVVIYLSNHARQPEIINDEFRDAVKWVPYSYIVATNNMYDWNSQTFSISDGELPPGMEFYPETGEIYGAPDTAGEYTFTVKVTYGREDYFEPSYKEFTIHVLDNEDETVFNTSDNSYELIPEGDEPGYIGKRVSDYRFELSSAFDKDEVFISSGEFSNFVKVWLNGEVLDPSEYSSSEGSTRIIINRETLEERSRKDGQRNTLSAEFDEGGERGDDLKRSSQNYYVEESEEEQTQTGPEATETGDTDGDSGTTEETGNRDNGTNNPAAPAEDTGNPSTSIDENNPSDSSTVPAEGSTDNADTADNDSTGNGSGRSSRSGGSSGGGSNSGTVTINAKVVNTSGSPMAGLGVEMHSTVKTATTNSAGTTVFSGMEMGSHSVTVKDANGGTLGSTGFTLVKGSAFSRSGSRITVVPGQTVNMTITVSASGVTITDVSAARDSNVLTGDIANLGNWAALLLAAFTGICILIRVRKSIA